MIDCPGGKILGPLSVGDEAAPGGDCWGTGEGVCLGVCFVEDDVRCKGGWPSREREYVSGSSAESGCSMNWDWTRGQTMARPHDWVAKDWGSQGVRGSAMTQMPERKRYLTWWIHWNCSNISLNVAQHNWFSISQDGQASKTVHCVSVFTFSLCLVLKRRLRCCIWCVFYMYVCKLLISPMQSSLHLQNEPTLPRTPTWSQYPNITGTLLFKNPLAISQHHWYIAFQ